MKLPKLAIDNHQFTIILMVLLVVLGVASFFTMPRSEDPQITVPGTTVIAVLPGANPKDLEELVVDPAEEALNELEDIKSIESKIFDGLANITIKFETGVDPDEKYDEVVQKLNEIEPDLPEEIARFDYWQWKSTDVVVFQGAIISETEDYKMLEKSAEKLKKQCEKVSGVRKVEITAYPEQEIHILADMERMNQFNISLSRLMNSIQSNNANIPGGHINISGKKYNIQTSGSYDDIAQIKNTVIDAREGKVLYVKDVATVEYSYENNEYFARFRGKNAMYITAVQKEGTNVYNILDGINEKIENYKKTLPPSIIFEKVIDQTTSVSYRLNSFFMNMLQGLILVGLVVLVAVGLKPSLIVLLVIPSSILIGLFSIDSSGFGIEQMSIAGFIIALGLLVDNAIVVVENITRFIKLGYKPLEAAVKGTSQIGWAIVSSTATTVLAFVPMIMMKNTVGNFIKSMPATVAFTLVGSLIVSLTFTPYLTGKLIKSNGNMQPNWIRRKLDNLIETRYRNTLSYSIRKPFVVLAIATVVFLGSLGLFPLVGISFFPSSDKPQFLIDITAPEGTSIDKTNEISLYVESALEKRDNVKVYAASVGKGNPRIYYNQMQTQNKSNYGQIFVELDSYDLEKLRQTVAELREDFNDYPGARIEIKTFEQGPPVDAPIAIKFLGEELDVLRKIAMDAENIYNSVPGVINVDNPLRTSKTDLELNIHREKASMYGVSIVEIDKTVRAAIAGLPVSKFRDKAGKEYSIVLKLPSGNKPTIKDFEKIYVSSVTGSQVPLLQLASLRYTSTPQKINHYNLDRSVTITADMESNQNALKATKEIAKKLSQYNFPNGYKYYVAGQQESQQESFGGMLNAIVIALLGIFGILVLQFKSYSQPLIVFSAIPLAIIGSILALLFSGNTFSFMAFIGITSLVGIVINNSIILVDYANQLREEGKSIVEAVKIAGETRFVPIILTTGTTIGGLLPLTLTGGNLWAPMGWTIIGGLLVSTVLTLIIVPVLYKLFSKETVTA